MDEDAALQNALLQSAQAANTNNDANKNTNSNNNNSSSSSSASSGSAMNVDSSSSTNANTNTNASSNNSNNNNNTGNDLMSTILGALGGSNANANNNNGGAASSGFNENDITTLTNLGYSRTQAQQALRACGGNVEMAASYLFQAFGGGLGF